MDDPSCAICKATQEMILHVLRDCKFASKCWMKFLSSNSISSFFSAGIEEWFDVNLAGKHYLGDGGMEASTLFVVQSWFLWKHRNGVVFEQRFARIEDLLRAAAYSARHIKEASNRYATVTPKVAKRGLWFSPDPGWIKINIDGASSKNKNWAIVCG